MQRSHRVLASATAAVALLIGAPVAAELTVPSLTPEPPPTVTPQASGEPLVGTFQLTAGTCSGAAKGSWFRMVQPNGSAASGPYVQNADSPCSDQNITPLVPGSDKGLVTGALQPHPSPEFDGSGNGLATRITKPTRFFGVSFATATNGTDPQTGVKVGPPSISVDGAGRLSGDVRSFAAAWNRQHFNQGSPKPDGSRPGTTSGPSGTYNASSDAFTLEWTSLIVGGPFNNFTGQWHLEGTFVSSSGAQAAQPSSGASAAGSGARTGSGRASSSSASSSFVGVTPTPPAGSHPRTGGGVPVLLPTALLAAAVATRALTRRAT